MDPQDPQDPQKPGEPREPVIDPNRTDGQVLTGVVKSWDVGRGFGFVTCSDGGADIFVHQSVVTVEGDRYRAIEIGTPVSCEYYVRDSKETARLCVGQHSVLPGFSSKAEAAQKLGPGTGIYAQGFAQQTGTNPNPAKLSGKVKWYNEAKGFGFLVGQNQDIYFKGSDVVSPGPALRADEDVTYDIMQGSDHEKKLWAVNISRVQSKAPPPAYPPYPPYYPPPRPDYYPPSPNSYYPPPGAERPGTMSGKVKWFNQSKGFGFILPDGGGTDLYFKGSDVLSKSILSTDDTVTFDFMKANDEEAKTWAINVRLKGAPRNPYPPSPSSYPPPPSPPSYPPYPYPPPPAHPGYPHYPPPPGAYPPPPEDYRPPYPYPYPYPPYAPPPPHPSTPYPDGYDPYPYYPPHPGSRPTGGQTGTVKWYNEKNGFGFVVPSVGGGDIYFKGTDVRGDRKLQTGDHVTYDLVIAKDAEAKQWAVNVAPIQPEGGPAVFGGKRKGVPEDYYGNNKRPSQYQPPFVPPQNNYAPGRQEPTRRR